MQYLPIQRVVSIEWHNKYKRMTIFHNVEVKEASYSLIFQNWFVSVSIFLFTWVRWHPIPVNFGGNISSLIMVFSLISAVPSVSTSNSIGKWHRLNHLHILYCKYPGALPNLGKFFFFQPSIHLSFSQVHLRKNWLNVLLHVILGRLCNRCLSMSTLWLSWY